MKQFGYINREYKKGITITITDREIVEKILYYGRQKNMNATAVVKKLMICKDNIDGLIDGLEREAYELLDEDQKIDVILKMQKKIKELEADKNA